MCRAGISRGLHQGDELHRLDPGQPSLAATLLTVLVYYTWLLYLLSLYKYIWRKYFMDILYESKQLVNKAKLSAGEATHMPIWYYNVKQCNQEILSDGKSLKVSQGGCVVVLVGFYKLDTVRFGTMWSLTCVTLDITTLPFPPSSFASLLSLI